MKLQSILYLLVLMSCTTEQKPAKEFDLPTAPRTLGEGFLYLNFQNYLEIPLYLNECDSLPCDTLRIRRINEEDYLFEFKTTHLSDSLRPFSILEGDTNEEIRRRNEEEPFMGFSEEPTLIFRVLEHDSINWRIVIYEESRCHLYKTAVIKYDSTQVDAGRFFNAIPVSHIAEDKIFGFESWKDRLTGGTLLSGAESLDTQEMMIYDRPNGKVIKTGRFYAISAVEMKGEWVRITHYSYGEKKIDGWMRWRLGEILLLDAVFYYE